MAFKPLIVDAGQLKQLPSGAGLDAGGWTFPSVGGTENYVLAADSSGNAFWAPTQGRRILTANENWYVSTTGNDTTGDGSSGTPWATITKAIEEAAKVLPGAYTVTINVAGGIYTYANTVSFGHDQGKQFIFRGAYTDVGTDATTFSIDAASVPDSTAKISKFDVVLTLPGGTTASVGQYILVTAVSGGTNPELLRGMHEVTAWDGVNNRATIQVWINSGLSATYMPSGTISCTFTIMETVHVMGSGDNGIVISGFIHGGDWDGFALQGPRNDTGDGISLTRRGYIQTAGRFGVSGFKYGCLATTGTSADLLQSTFSANSASGVRCQGGYISARFCVCTGTRLNAVQVTHGGDIRASFSEIYGCNICSSCANSSWMNWNNGIGAYANIGVYADGHCTVNADNTTLTGVTTNRNPAVDEGNFGCYIIGIT